MAPVEVLPEGQATEDGESSSSVDKVGAARRGPAAPLARPRVRFIDARTSVARRGHSAPPRPQVVAQVDERSGPGPGSGPKGWSKGEMERPRQNSNKGWFARMLCCLMPRAQRGGYDDWNNGNGDGEPRAGPCLRIGIPAAARGKDRAPPSADTEFNRDATEAELGGHRALDADGKPQPHIAVAVAPQAPIRDLINSPRSHAEARGMRDFSADDDRDLEAPAPPPASANPIIYSVDVAPGRARLVFTASSSTPAGSAGWIPRGVPIPSEGERWAGYPNCVIGPAHEMDRKKKTLVRCSRCMQAPRPRLGRPGQAHGRLTLTVGADGWGWPWRSRRCWTWTRRWSTRVSSPSPTPTTSYRWTSTGGCWTSMF